MLRCENNKPKKTFKIKVPNIAKYMQALTKIQQEAFESGTSKREYVKACTMEIVKIAIKY